MEFNVLEVASHWVRVEMTRQTTVSWEMYSIKTSLWENNIHTQSMPAVPLHDFLPWIFQSALQKWAIMASPSNQVCEWHQKHWRITHLYRSLPTLFLPELLLQYAFCEGSDSNVSLYQVWLSYKVSTLMPKRSRINYPKKGLPIVSLYD